MREEVQAAKSANPCVAVVLSQSQCYDGASGYDYKHLVANVQRKSRWSDQATFAQPYEQLAEEAEENENRSSRHEPLLVSACSLRMRTSIAIFHWFVVRSQDTSTALFDV